MKKQQLVRVGAIVAVTAVSVVVLQSRDPEGSAAPVPMAAAGTQAEGGLPTTFTQSPAPEAPETVAPAPEVAIWTAPPRNKAPEVTPDQASPAVEATGAPHTSSEPVRMAEAPAAEATPSDGPAPAQSCREDMVLLPQPGAMLDLGLLAPCRPDERVVIRHGDLVVTGKTSASGTLVASLPAFAAQAEVSVTFGDGVTTSASAEVKDLTQFDRFAVQWMEGDAFSLHAIRAGGSFNGEGHVSASAPGTPSAAGHFLTLLGDAGAERPLLAEVYTWPAGTASHDAAIAFSLEAPVTPQSCGRDMPGETLQLTSGRLLTRELTLTMPDCAAVGEFLVLPNPVSAEKLAAN